LTITCPQCGRAGRADDDAAGRVVGCAVCHHLFRAPDAPPPPDGAPAPGAPPLALPVAAPRRSPPPSPGARPTVFAVLRIAAWTLCALWTFFVTVAYLIRLSGSRSVEEVLLRQTTDALQGLFLVTGPYVLARAVDALAHCWHDPTGRRGP
jgi:hypothetical protein